MHAIAAVQNRASVASLREMLGSVQGVQSKGTLLSKDFPGLIPRGGIVEVIGTSRTEWVVSLLAENPTVSVAWVEESLSVLPPAIQQRGVELERILFIEAKQELEWSLQTVLRSQLFSVVVSHGDIRDEKKLRRFQLLAERAKACIFLISKIPARSWAVSVQIEACDQHVKLLKKKG